MLMFEAGRAIIQSMGSPFRYGGRDYYFDNHPGIGRDQIQCSIPIDELKQLSKDQGKRSAENSSTSTTSLPTGSTSPPKMSPGELLDNLRYKNGSSPKVFTWACRREAEQCCGTECCPVESKMKTIGIVIAIVAVVLLALLCCCCLCPMLSKGGFTGSAGGEHYFC
uniref:C. briggsae CBR-PQN-83 protein n=1 Tax=Haemonchus contortus TaxID=6289 RepID=W6NH87_HAECO